MNQTITGAQHNVYLTYIASLKEVFASVATSEERAKRQGLVPVVNADGSEGAEIGWVVHEWDTMHAEVNRLRARHGLGPVSIVEVRSAEALACGHSDYASKYALKCANLVIDDNPDFGT